MLDDNINTRERGKWFSKKQVGLRKFCKALDPDLDKLVFQTFDDNKNRNDGRLAKEFIKLSPSTLNEMNGLNSDGACIALTINDTGGRHRCNSNVVRIRGVWHEDDGDTSPPANFPLEPSLVVQTSEGKYHRYWLVDGEWPCDDSGKSDFRGVMRTLVREYNSDPGACDLARALRVPGFLHQKDPDNPQLVKVVAGLDRRVNRYSREQILVAFAPLAVDEVEPEERTIDWGKNNPRLVEALQSVSPDVDRDDWLRIACGIHHECGGEMDGFEVWDKWSSTGKKYPGREKLIRQWNSLGGGSGPKVTIATVFHIARAYGWQHASNAEANANEFPVTLLKDDGELVRRIEASLRDQFADWRHHPSDKHWEGIRQICAAVEGMAEGSLDKKFWVSSLPPGMGKTTTLVHAVRELANFGPYHNKSIIIFLSRIEEIAKLANAMNLSNEQFSVLTSDQEINALGNQNKRQARVLFTTQQMLESKCKRYAAFADIDDFKYTGSFGGEPMVREIRVWDEAIVPAMTVTLERYAIGRLYQTLSYRYAAIASALEDFANQLKNVPDESLVTIPNVADDYGLGEPDAKAMFKADSDKTIVSTLWLLSGRTVRVRRDRSGNTVLDYEDILPEDLAPLLILDASGRHRKTYKLWFEDRKGLAFLFSPEKYYSNLTIHHWDTASGKSAYENNGGFDQIDGIARTINYEIPSHENVLVVHFKADPRTKISDVPTELAKRIKINSDLEPSFGRDRISYLNYGRHTATNDFENYRYVILCGAFGYPTSVIEAMARGAKKIEAREELSEQDFRDVKLGELTHHIYQAANRGLMRKADGDDCPQDCHLYIIASGKSGLPNAFSDVFPKANIIKWKPIYKLGKRLNLVADYLLDQWGKGRSEIAKQEIIEAVVPEGRDRNPANFNRTMLKHPDLARYLCDNGVLYANLEGVIRLAD